MAGVQEATRGNQRGAVLSSDAMKLRGAGGSLPDGASSPASTRAPHAGQLHDDAESHAAEPGEGHHAAASVKYSLSVTGVHSNDDESMFEKAYDSKLFRHEAADVLQAVGPRVGSKHEAVDPWVNIAATKVEVIFRKMMKDILTAGRQSNEKERATLREWLDDRDARILRMQQDRDKAEQELQDVRKEMLRQAELIGRSATEAFQQKAEQERVDRELADLHTMKAEYELRERQFVDSLSHCRKQIEEQQAEILRLNQYMENALQERSDSSKQFEQVRRCLERTLRVAYDFCAVFVS